MVAFPLSPAPAWFTYCDWNTTGYKRNGVHYVGDTVTVHLVAAGSTGYTVYDFDGDIVSSGSMSAAATSVTPTVPVGGWSPGWYRIVFRGPNSDALFGTTYAVTNFCVIRSNANFNALPDPTANVGGDDPTLHGLGSASVDGEYFDYPMAGVMGLGTSRLNYLGGQGRQTSPGSWLTHVEADATLAANWWTNPGASYLDPTRTRYLYCSFPNGAYDLLALPASSGTFVNAYCKDGTVNGATTFVSIAAGSVSGSKIVVSSPTSGAVVETYDNLASRTAAITAINAASAYIRVFNPGGGTDTPGTLTSTAIGSTFYTMTVNAVAGLYPGVTRFEGPVNEPPMNLETVQQMKLFQAAVHAGNASAVAMGPCPVNIDAATWTTFLGGGGGAFCDEISFHAYNSATNGDINLGRTKIAAFQSLLATYGLSNKTLWQTESSGAQCSVYGVYHPRRARKLFVDWLLWEQYGVPRERNNPWYGRSHGYWSVPAWSENEEGSLNPQAPAARVLAELTWGMTHDQILDFGDPGNNIFLGSVYAAVSGKTVVVMTTSALPGATVTLGTNATGSLTATDSFGNTSTVTVSGGLVTIPTGDMPTYLSLPAGAAVSVYSVNDWPQVKVNGQGVDLASRAVHAVTVGSTLTGIPTSGGFSTDYATHAGVFYSANTPTEAATLTWEHAARVDRVIIWCGSAWQNDSALLTFTIDSSVDGSAWVTQKTVDVSSTATAFKSGSDLYNSGCQMETYWPEQWVFDETLPAPVTLKALRVNVTATSYGGEPTAACVTAGGQGNASQHVVLQRIACMCDANTQPEYLA